MRFISIDTRKSYFAMSTFLKFRGAHPQTSQDNIVGLIPTVGLDTWKLHSFMPTF